MYFRIHGDSEIRSNEEDIPRIFSKRPGLGYALVVRGMCSFIAQSPFLLRLIAVEHFPCDASLFAADLVNEPVEGLFGCVFPCDNRFEQIDQDEAAGGVFCLFIAGMDAVLLALDFGPNQITNQLCLTLIALEEQPAVSKHQIAVNKLENSLLEFKWSSRFWRIL